MIDIGQILTDEQENQDIWFKSEMTHRQFASLSLKLVSSEIEKEIINLEHFQKRITKAKNLNLGVTEKWLKNSWNTENVLIQNKSIIENTGQSFAMQWAFPQAYYSTFGSLLAHFKALGYTQESHKAVLRNFSTLVEQNKFPRSISFYCTGGKKNIEFVNITKPNDLESFEFDTENIRTIDNQICQFLNATREIKLNEKAPDLKFTNRNGQKRKKLSPAMWQQVSNAIGNTTIMDLLYRKRIKANYQDIETFSTPKFKGIQVLSNLSEIVNILNFINESYIAKAIGIDNYEKILNSYLKSVNNEIVKLRFETTKKIINTL